MRSHRTKPKRLAPAGLAILFSASLILAGAIPAAGQEAGQEVKPFEKMVLQARLMPQTTGQPAMVQFQIDALSTPEEVRNLQSTLSAGGEVTFRTEFRKTPKATMKFFEGGSTIRFSAAYIKPTDKGTQIILFGEDQTLGTVSNDVPLGLFFLVVVLDINEKGRGDGRIYQSASVKFVDESRMELDTYRRSPRMLIQVRKTK